MCRSYTAGRGSAGWLLAAAALLVPGASAAQESLAWQAPAECPGRARVEAEIAELVQHAPRTADASTPTVVITRLSPTLLQARVSVRAREHVLHDASCEALMRAAALVVALAIEEAAPRTLGAGAVAARNRPKAAVPNALGSGGAAGDAAMDAASRRTESASAAPRDEVEADSAAAPQVASAAAVDAAAAPRDVVRFEVALRPRAPEPPVLFTRESRVRPDAPGRERDSAAPPTAAQRLGVFVGAAAGLATGIIPKLAPLFGLHAGVTRGVWCAALRLGFAPGQTALLDTASGAGGKVALALGALEGGLRLRALGLELPMLVGVESGVFFARGLGVSESSARVSDWLAGYLSPGISYTWSDRLRLLLRLDGLVALRRPRFALEAVDASERVFHQPERLAARVYLGLEVRLR